MKFGAINTKTYGLIVLSKEGFYDMPGRRPPYSKDWGDTVTPLLNVADTKYKAQLFEADFLYDYRVTGFTLAQMITYLKGLGEFTLDLEVASVPTPMNQFSVKVQEVIETRRRKLDGFSIFKIIFFHRLPTFHSFTVTRTNVTALQYGVPGNRYDFKNFDMVLKKLHNLNSVPELKDSSLTVYQAEPFKTIYRKPKKIELELALVNRGGSFAIYNNITKLEALKYIIYLPGTHKELLYSGVTYNTYCVDPFKVKFLKNGRGIEFTLPLYIV